MSEGTPTTPEKPTRIVLIHLSDLHIGEVLLNKKTRLISGWRCHDVKLAKALYTALRSIPSHLNTSNGTDYFFLVTGDLTSLGLPMEFYVARCFLHLRVPDDYDTMIDSTGLAIPLSKIMTIPGNHDHWYPRFPYTFSRGYSPSLFPMLFKSCPWKQEIISSDNRLAIEVFGVDSGSGFEKSLLNFNIEAKGQFSEHEVAMIEKLLQTRQRPDGRKRVRLLLCHHALTPKRRFGFDAQPLDPDHARWLISQCITNGVSAILTGHHHLAFSERFSNNSALLYELRSPSTLVPGNDGQSGFFVHTLEIDAQNNNVNWISDLWLYYPHQGRFMSSQREVFQAVEVS